MKVSEINRVSEETVELFREGNFDTVKLIGKEQKVNGTTITFLGDKKYIESFLNTPTDCVICTEEIAQIIGEKYNGGIAYSSNPKTSFFEVHNYLAEKSKVIKENEIASSAIVHPNAIIEDYNIMIGENTIICANAVIKSGTIIGNDCVLREGVIVGTPGFYYFGEGEKKKLVMSTGRVCIGNNVELHPKTIIEKGVLYGDTIIGDNTKIDNLTLIGHDSNIGSDCIIAGNTTFAGGVEFGNGAFAGVGVSVAPYVKIGEFAKLSSGAVVTQNVNANSHVSGNFAVEHSKYIKHIKEISK